MHPYMQIFVKFPDNKTITHEVQATYTIGNTKALNHNCKGIPSDQQRLILEDTELENDHATLFDINVVDGAFYKRNNNNSNNRNNNNNNVLSYSQVQPYLCYFVSAEEENVDAPRPPTGTASRIPTAR